MADLASFTAELKAVRSNNTAATYTCAVERFLRFLERKGWSAVTAPPNVLSAWIQEDLGHEVKPWTVRKYAYAAQQYAEWERRRGVQVPEWAKPLMPRTRQAIRTVLRGTQLHHYAARAGNLHEPYRTICLLLLATALRVSEATALKKGDLEIIDNSGRREAWLIVRGAEDAHNRKSKRDRRVPLLPEAQAILGHYLRYERPKLIAGNYLFPAFSISGQAIRVRSVEKCIVKIGNEMGLRLTAHDLRHSALTSFAEQGVPMSILQQIAGHERLVTTQHYVHSSTTAIYDAFEKGVKAPWSKK